MKVVLNVNAPDLNPCQQQPIGIDEHKNDEDTSVDAKINRIQTNIVFELSWSFVTRIKYFVNQRLVDTNQNSENTE